MSNTDEYQPFQSPRAPAASFWDALTPVERTDFASSAAERTFAGGATLMEEGETADHVIVILSGRTKICVEKGGVERVIAYRGPGQLIGERAALQVSVRSATVVALQTVHALAMKTEDFASFVSNHQGVLDIVEGQVYQRLREDPGFRGCDGHHTTEAGLAAALNPSAQAHRALGLDGQHCLIIYTDVVEFGSLTRNDDHRSVITREMREMTSASLGPAWDQCSCEDRGDGLLIAVPPHIPTIKVLECLLTALPIALKRHNSIYGPGAQIQLRVALDVGPVRSVSSGVSGRVVIDAARLLDAPAFKDAIRESHANLGIIVSDFVYQRIIKNADYLTDAASYSAVRDNVKELSLQAWMKLIDPSPQMPPRVALASARMAA